MTAKPRPREMGKHEDGFCAECRLMARLPLFIKVEPYYRPVLSGWPLPSFHKFRLQMARRALISHQSGRPRQLVKTGHDAGIKDRGRGRWHTLGRDLWRESGADNAVFSLGPCGATRYRDMSVQGGRVAGRRRKDYSVNGSLVGRAKARSAVSSIRARSILR